MKYGRRVSWKIKQMCIRDRELVGHLRFEPEYLMFQPDNKRGGIIKMMEHLNADIKDVVVFGDDYNDMDMFCPEWFSIAMGNACQDLKDIANYVTAVSYTHLKQRS